MKKIIATISILLIAAACSRPISDNYQKPLDRPATTTPETLPKENKPGGNILGQPVTLKKGETAVFEGGRVSLKVLDFYYQPCPEGAQCFWSGLDVYYELVVDGKTYIHNTPGTGINAPYEVNLKDSDYKTYATFVVSKK